MTNIQTEHTLSALGYSIAAAELAKRGVEWAGDEGTLAHAQVLATLSLGEAVLAVADAIREAGAT
jgi:uncharacterized membrane protein (DUF441 family)